MLKSVQGKAKSILLKIWQARTRDSGLRAYEDFVPSLKDKYPGTLECLVKDFDNLFAFYEFTVSNRLNIRTVNSIESSLAEVRLKTANTKGCGSRTAALSMVFKLHLESEKSRRKIDGYKEEEKVVGSSMGNSRKRRQHK